jgi:hypothetical protein
VFLNGHVVQGGDVGAFKSGDQINISNPVPYSRKIEAGRGQMSVPGHVYEETALLVAGRYGNRAAVKFTFMPVRFGDVATFAAFSRRIRPGRRMSEKARQDWLVRQPAIEIKARLGIMADYAGAVAAMRTFFEARYSATPIAYQNEDAPSDPWPPVDGTGKPVPWLYFEVVQVETRLRGVGLPGNQVWLTVGFIRAHVFAPKGYGFAEHLAIAGLAAEVFRRRLSTTRIPAPVCAAGARTGEGPTIQGGDSASDDGNWFGVVVTVPFQFFFTK